MFAHLNNHIRALAVLTSVEKTAPSKADKTNSTTFLNLFLLLFDDFFLWSVMPGRLKNDSVVKFHLMAYFCCLIHHSRDLTMVERALNHPDHICILLSLSVWVKTGGYGIILLYILICGFYNMHIYFWFSY